MKLVLASTSTYRRALLSRLTTDFLIERPEVDEAPLPGESPQDTATRLALAKVCAVAKAHPDALIIGSDQVACAPGEAAGQFEIFSKPGTPARAVAQLQRMRGRSVFFHTAVCVFNAADQRHRGAMSTTEVRVRDLSDEEIIRYVARDQPVDCAGSAKVESLGITLLDYVRDDDPTALIGLPLIALSSLLRAEGLCLP